ncbi:MAG: hypothetical protein JO231_04240, partial [Acidobacteria bacterium]|nr:hypothetical protein [Acidobacteriota bacterium]
TFEHFEWEGPRISTYTNRQGQKVTYSYYPDTGKLFQIVGSVVLDEFRYDSAGRVSMMRTPDAEIDIDSYDKEGHPNCAWRDCKFAHTRCATSQG